MIGLVCSYRVYQTVHQLVTWKRFFKGGNEGNYNNEYCPKNDKQYSLHNGLCCMYMLIKVQIRMCIVQS